jgi:ribosomal protein S27AE
MKRQIEAFCPVCSASLARDAEVPAQHIVACGRCKATLVIDARVAVVVEVREFKGGHDIYCYDNDGKRIL